MILYQVRMPIVGKDAEIEELVEESRYSTPRNHKIGQISTVLNKRTTRGAFFRFPGHSQEDIVTR